MVIIIVISVGIVSDEKIFTAVNQTIFVVIGVNVIIVVVVVVTVVVAETGAGSITLFVL